MNADENTPIEAAPVLPPERPAPPPLPERLQTPEAYLERIRAMMAEPPPRAADVLDEVRLLGLSVINAYLGRVGLDVPTVARLLDKIF